MVCATLTGVLSHHLHGRSGAFDVVYVDEAAQVLLAASLAAHLVQLLRWLDGFFQRDFSCQRAKADRCSRLVPSCRRRRVGFRVPRSGGRRRWRWRRGVLC